MLLPPCEHDPDVLRDLQARLAVQGRLTFAEVMEIALYHPVGGYYTAHVALGPEGDFVTAPEEHPAFGALLARQAAQCWQALGAPDTLLLVEMGGGRGTLAAALLAHARDNLPDFFAAIQYLLIDRSPRLIAEQRARLAAFGPRVAWADAVPGAFTGVLLSNELVDAFPVHRVVMRAGALRECYVIARAGEFAWEEGDVSSAAVDDYFSRFDITLADGQQAEVNLAAPAWMQAVGRALTRGVVLTIDFGHLASALYRPERRNGTLLAYRRQCVTDELLICLGRQDLIAQVNFSALVDAGNAAGLTPLGLVTQQNFLLDLGIEGWLAALDDGKLSPQERVGHRRGLLALLNSAEDGLGDAKVLVQAKGVSARLDGLSPAARSVNATKLRKESLPTER